MSESGLSRVREVQGQVSQIAIGRLASIQGRKGSHVDPVVGVEDAFSEVFANIAATTIAVRIIVSI